MKNSVRIIKSRARINLEATQPIAESKSYRQTTREMAANVKNWVTQTKQRQRDEERRLAALLK